jgi:hypothetical protein
MKFQFKYYILRKVYKYSNVYLNRCAKWHEYQLPLPFHILKIRNKHSQTNEYLHFKTFTTTGSTSTAQRLKNCLINAQNNSDTKLLDDKLKKQINMSSSSSSSNSFLITSLNFQVNILYEICIVFTKQSIISTINF